MCAQELGDDDAAASAFGGVAVQGKAALRAIHVPDLSVRGRTPDTARSPAGPLPRHILLDQTSFEFSKRARTGGLNETYLTEDRIARCMKFLLWCVLLVLCWPLALLALVVYPLVWILLIPFRVVGIAVDGVLELLRSIVMLPARLMSGPRAR
jgi:hypothetical protein